ncbi:MAG: lytic exoenzyme target recognition domain-containing protein [Thomasclavelia ramosa]
MKVKGILFGALATIGLFAGMQTANAYEVNNEFNLSPWEGSGQVAVPNKIILHETANERATGRNEATYMKNNWFNAHTTAIVGDGGIVYKIAPEGNISWGAGNANPYAPIQIELQHTHDKELFKKNYKAYIDYTRDMGKKFGIPMTLDQGSSVWEKGVISHKWVSDYVWGDHTDPYGYLAEMGISKAQLAKDLANGVQGDSKPSNPVTPNKPSKPSVTPQKQRFNYRVDGLEYVNGMWQIYNEHLGKIDFNWTDNGIPVSVVDKVNPATGQPTKDQVLSVGDYFNFQVNSVGVVQEQTPYGGYTLSHVQLPEEFIWLFTENKNTLLYQ